MLKPDSDLSIQAASKMGVFHAMANISDLTLGSNKMDDLMEFYLECLNRVDTDPNWKSIEVEYSGDVVTFKINNEEFATVTEK